MAVKTKLLTQLLRKGVGRLQVYSGVYFHREISVTEHWSSTEVLLAFPAYCEGAATGGRPVML